LFLLERKNSLIKNIIAFSILKEKLPTEKNFLNVWYKILPEPWRLLA
jgi:hypothetical protein